MNATGSLGTLPGGKVFSGHLWIPQDPFGPILILWDPFS